MRNTFTQIVLFACAKWKFQHFKIVVLIHVDLSKSRPNLNIFGWKSTPGEQFRSNSFNNSFAQMMPIIKKISPSCYSEHFFVPCQKKSSSFGSVVKEELGNNEMRKTFAQIVLFACAIWKFPILRMTFLFMCICLLVCQIRIFFIENQRQESNWDQILFTTLLRKWCKKWKK